MEHWTSPALLAIRLSAAAEAMLSGSGLSCMMISKDRLSPRNSMSFPILCLDLLLEAMGILLPQASANSFRI
jgi:hypothetical protein